MQARVLGYVFNPLSAVLVPRRRRACCGTSSPKCTTPTAVSHAYLLPPHGDRPAMVTKKLYVSPFNDVDGLLPGAGSAAG